MASICFLQGKFLSIGILSVKTGGNDHFHLHLLKTSSSRIHFNSPDHVVFLAISNFPSSHVTVVVRVVI